MYIVHTQGTETAGYNYWLDIWQHLIKATHTGQQWDERDPRNARFSVTGLEKQVNDQFAIDLIAQVPPIVVSQRIVSWKALPRLKHNCPFNRGRVWWRRRRPGSPQGLHQPGWRGASQLHLLRTQICVRGLSWQGQALILPGLCPPYSFCCILVPISII